jgi:hypothetical protein
MADVTIIIPYAPHHEPLLSRAIESIERQTVPTLALPIRDDNKRGPAWGRNQGLAQVTTEYVGFCDADDWIEPEFVEQCLPILKPGTYAYTDWHFADNSVHPASNTPWRGKDDWHLVNVLMLTSDARRVGPFDETLACMEDTDWFLKAALYDICGQRVPLPLVHYTGAGRRSAQAVRNGQMETHRLKLKERYAYKMGCCGGQDNPELLLPVGQRQPGDVLAMALWHGNHVEHGKATGRTYPRLSWPRTTYVAPADIDRDPLKWRRVEAPPAEITPVPVNGNGAIETPYHDVEGLAAAVIEAGLINPPPPVDLGHVPASMELMNPEVINNPYQPSLAETLTPDYARLAELGRARYA